MILIPLVRFNAEGIYTTEPLHFLTHFHDRLYVTRNHFTNHRICLRVRLTELRYSAGIAPRL